MTFSIRRGLLAASVLSLASTALFGQVAVAKTTYKEPRLTVSKQRLEAALHCPVPLVRGKGKQPLMLVTGTGYTGAEAYAIGSAALKTLGRPICYVDFPYRTTGDIQIATQYLVYGLRTMAQRAGQPIAVYGISQGALLPRIALTYWPSLGKKVTDVIAVAGTQHGTTLIGECSAAKPCMPAAWQQRAGSKLLKAINSQRDESPGPTDWTTIRSATDETVQPQTGSNPTSSLKGASNILIQSVCPGRKTGHIGSALDSVAFFAALDALGHKGPANVKRFPKNVCASLLAPGLSSSAKVAGVFVPDPQTPAPPVPAEPRVQKWLSFLVP